MKKKHRDLSSPDISTAKRSKISHIIDTRLKAALTKDQIATLEKNKDIYAQLVGSAPAAQSTATAASKKEK
ncbi:hypothetical protein [Flavobacterium sp. N1946]|uniref:hypothetical protein n=1 Tax=Flavobacterium sp. N1946 TaxID=2986826 RepID=UPI00222407C9|nr:hypothetical protein [Flavobacterium sp. N1946]